MKISYNWLKDFIKTDLSPVVAAEMLTGCGLEVESIEKFESVKGGLEGIVIGEVKTKDKHPDADRLSITTVDVGTGTLLNIVCGASNVAAGQKVVVATVGAMLYPAQGEPFQIKKSKIRGHLSEGMICAEDEIGLGASHEGIMVLNEKAIVGTPAAEYFNVEHDHVFEIGLTPNRADATSHVGVARDLAAVLSSKYAMESHAGVTIDLPAQISFNADNKDLQINVIVEDAELCPRYSGVSISGVKVGPSPAWLKQRLESIGLKSINNIVDATNYVLHELGQPLHAFDADKIEGKKIIVKTLPKGTKFKTLDEKERELTGEELMICNAKQGMCMAGVFGGIDSGVTEKTKNIFIESACFHPTAVRKTAKIHDLKTDASFRFERGSDPDITVYALKRVVQIIREVAGGKISSDIIDIYPEVIEPYKVGFSYKNCDTLIGKVIDHKIIKSILTSLGISIISEGTDALQLSVPLCKIDVTREADVIEEILRIYGYNNIELPEKFNSSLSFSQKPDKNKYQNAVANLLCSNGFTEVMNTSLTKESYSAAIPGMADKNIALLNSLSSDLGVLRQTLLFSGLETIAYNLNRKTQDVKIFEFGKTYQKENEAEWKYKESAHLSLFITGKKNKEAWNLPAADADLFTLKGAVQSIFEKFGLHATITVAADHDQLSDVIIFSVNKKDLAVMGKVKQSLLKVTDVKQPVYYADVNWDALVKAAGKTKVEYNEISKFPSVRRDLALLIDSAVKFEQLESIARSTERKLLKEVNIFDVYEGDKLEAGKKSYALSFILQDNEATLTDKQIESVMTKLQKNFEEQLGAKIR